MKLKLLPFFILALFLTPIIFLPSITSAAEAEYIPLITFEDDDLGVFGNPTVDFVIVNETGNKVMKEVGSGQKSLFWRDSPAAQYSNYELSFNFKVKTVGSTDFYDLFCYKANASYTWGLRISIQYANQTGGYLYVCGVDTAQFVSYNTWHKMFVNVTSTTQVRYSYDDGALSTPYTMANNPTNGKYGMGNTYTAGTGTVFWDNILLATRIGSIPISSFTYSPENGDGLTNFIFHDESAFDTIPFEETVYWDFGDGNYTYGTVGGYVNHTYIHEGTYQVILNCSNRLGYDLAYTNITVTGISIGGGEEVSDEMFGFIALLALITALNLYAMKSSSGLLSIFALMGLIVSAGLLWPDSPITTALLVVTALGNIAITIKTVT